MGFHLGVLRWFSAWVTLGVLGASCLVPFVRESEYISQVHPNSIDLIIQLSWCFPPGLHIRITLGRFKYPSAQASPRPIQSKSLGGGLGGGGEVLRNQFLSELSKSSPGDSNMWPRLRPPNSPSS